MICLTAQLRAQESAGPAKDSAFFRLPLHSNPSTDSLPAGLDTLISGALAFRLASYKKITSHFYPDSLAHQGKRDVSNQLSTCLNQALDLSGNKHGRNLKSPWLTPGAAQAGYQFYYRSVVDTPFQDSRISQHLATGQMGLTIGQWLPLRLSVMLRRSNSPYYRDVSDVQVRYDGAAFSRKTAQVLHERIAQALPCLRDSLREKWLAQGRAQWNALNDWRNNPYTIQNLIEARELLRIPSMTYDVNLDEKANQKRSDSMLAVARKFVEFYDYTGAQMSKWQRWSDSLQVLVDSSLRKIKAIQTWLNQPMASRWNSRQLDKELSGLGLSHWKMPKGLKWLMGVRQLALGRSQVNYSDLTARNVGINGINFEYNSWYYLALTVGALDYRYRDFMQLPSPSGAQYLTMIRAGLGRLEGSHFILSAFHGRKQMFRPGNDQGKPGFVYISGLSLATRVDLLPGVYINGEWAESVSPDFRNNPLKENTRWGLSDGSNQAYGAGLHGYWPRSNTRIEGHYQYSGANYQSFAAYQTNTGRRQWRFKADQSLFRRQLRISVALRNYDYFNPFIVQQYQTNTVFKSVSAAFRKKHWPSISVGYQPMTQWTRMGDQILENRFQSLNLSAFHTYRIKKSRASSLLVVNRFFNASSDTGFVYYQATNLYGMQSFYFSRFNASLGLSFTRNAAYQLAVIEESVQWRLHGAASLGFGCKINKYSYADDQVRLGYFLNLNWRAGRSSVIAIQGEHGFLPANKSGLVPNDIVYVQLIRSFSF